MYEFKMPSLGADMDSGKLIEWKVKPGDRVKKGDIIAEVETTKSVVDVEVFHDGIVERVLVEPSDEDIPVGTVLALLKTEEGEEIPAPAPAAAATPTLMPVSKAAPTSASTPATPSARINISPAAKKLAEQSHLDISQIKGTGPGGSISIKDVERRISAQTPSAEAVPVPAEDKKLSMRRAIAAAMARSNREIPHYYLETTVAMDRALQWLEAENKNRPPATRILSAALLIKAVALALKEFPEFNGFYLNDAFQPGQGIHVGVAISLRGGGLMAPALHHADQKNLETIMAGLKDLVQRTRTGKLKSSELTDPTITLTNLGETGVEKVFGVIYPPQVALVGFGRIIEIPFVEHQAIRPGRAIVATLSADHRASDGHRGALFLLALSKWLQQPEALNQ